MKQKKKHMEVMKKENIYLQMMLIGYIKGMNGILCNQ